MEKSNFTPGVDSADWLIQQLEKWPERVDWHSKTDPKYLMGLASAALRAIHETRDNDQFKLSLPDGKHIATVRHSDEYNFYVWVYKPGEFEKGSRVAWPFRTFGDAVNNIMNTQRILWYRPVNAPSVELPVDQNETPPFSLHYNHLIRAASPPACPKGELVPVIDDVKISRWELCLESTGYTTIIDREIAEASPEYKWGFRFIGDNGIHYRPNGSTTIDGSPGMNDITHIIKT